MPGKNTPKDDSSELSEQHLDAVAGGQQQTPPIEKITITAKRLPPAQATIPTDKIVVTAKAIKPNTVVAQADTSKK